MAQWRIPLARPRVSTEDMAAVAETLASDQLSLGPRMRAFEEDFAQRIGQPCLSVSSGTAALHLGLLASDVGPGDEIITTAYSVPASVNPIFATGARPIFVDIDQHTRAIDPERVEQAINAKTRGVLAVHPQAAMANLDALLPLCQKHGIDLFEDACEALGARNQGRMAGISGAWGAFGFYPNKQITTGEGGIFTSASEALLTRVERLRNHGRTMDGSWLDQQEIGFNYRLPDMAAALGRSQLARLDTIVARRRAIAVHYDELLSSVAAISLPPRADHPTWFCYVIELRGVSAEQRDRVMEKMAEAGIQCGRYFAPLHRQPAIQSRLGTIHLPHTEEVSTRSLALPFYEGMRDEDCETVVSRLKNLL